MLRPATPLTILLLAAFILLLLSVISTPVIKGIPLASFRGVDFGVFGYCTPDGGCTGIRIGYPTDSNTLFGENDNSDFSLPNGARSSLPSILIVHPVAALLTLICTILAASSHFHSPSHSPRFLLALLILLIPTLLVTLLAFLVDILLFVPHLRWGGWIVLVSTILIVAAGVVTCAMRRTLVSRKARKKRIAENAEMNGENFYNRQNSAPAAPAGARAETPPPLTSQPPPSMANGGPGADKLPSFTAYEKNPRDFEDDRVPLNARTPSNRTLPSNGMQSQSPDENFDTHAGPGRAGPARGGPRVMGGGRGGYGGPRDEYGNPLPPSNAFGPMPGPMRRDPSDPGMRHQYSDDGMGGARGRGRGGYPARGYGRGGPYGPGRGGPHHYGRGAPMGIAAGAGAGMMAGEMRNGGGQGPPPGYGNGYTPMAGERPGQYEPAGAAGYGRSPSAPAYGRRSPGPPSAPGYARQPSPGPPSNPAGYGRRPSPGPPSNPGGFGRQPSPGGRSAPPGGYGRHSPGPPSAPAMYARQRSNSNPGGYDFNGRQPSPGAYQGQRMRPESPPPPMPVPANEGAIGQAVEMDATTGSPSHTPAPYQPMQLHDSDSDVQGLVGLQRQREHRESPLSLTSVYSSQEPYVPPRAAWANPASRSNTANAPDQTQNMTSPIADSPVTELPANTVRSPPIPQLTSTAPNSNTATQILGHNRYNSTDTYIEDVDPRFAEPAELRPQQILSSAPLPSALTAGLHPQRSQQGMMEHANDSHHNKAYLQPSHSYESIPDDTHDAGTRSPAVSDGSNYTSISQRGINPAWQPPANHAMGMGGVPNRKPMGPQRDVVLASNPDFELPLQGSRPGTAGGRPRAASRGQRQPGMIPGMEPGHGGRYPGGNAF
ncbi:MAG: hypothetical protein LQ348_006890 [Seirophora lacunosa]|nr:MAG: hypothetical protein LQ348_006890 [Seirophora lacunosa]